MRFIAVAARVLVAVVIFAAALAKAAADVKWWTPDDWFTWVLLALPAAVVVVAAIVDAVRVYRKPNLERDRKQVTLLLRGLALTTADESGVPERYVGVNVFLESRTRGRLNRMFRERFNPQPQESTVRWTVKKGFIGRVATTARPLAVDLDRDYPALAAAKSESAFNALSEQDRFGFTWEEWRQLEGKYQAIFACPILNASRTRVVGVLSIDLPVATAIAGHGALFDDPAITDAGEAIAVAVGAVLAQR